MVFWCKFGGVGGGEVGQLEHELEGDNELTSKSDSDIARQTKV
jgi:hypothetical protein